MMTIQIIANGIILGSVYALIALGLNLTFGIMKVINFAHGQMYMLGTFIAYYIYGVYGYNYFIALFVSVFVLAIIGVIMERLFRHVLRYAEREEVTMLLALGVSLFFSSVALHMFGEKVRGIQDLIGGVYKIYNTYLPAQRVLIFLMAILSMITFLYFLKYTKTGRALRALAQNREVSCLMGINVNKTSMIGYAIGAALAGMSGTIVAFIFSIYAGSGEAITIKAFIMIMIGGAGVIPGAILGGFILGMLEAVGYGLIGGSLTFLLIYLGVIIFLIFKPNGIMGKPW
ncbi:MAG: branched-chain amino acid ABC transporter permease [Atribacterota bacterium]|nr:branched-chain amino acid ABC transporter permease [Atribacterota bacterium]